MQELTNYYHAQVKAHKYPASLLPGAQGAAPDVAGDAELGVEVLAGGQVHLQLVQHDRVGHLRTKFKFRPETFFNIWFQKGICIRIKNNCEANKLLRHGNITQKKYFERFQI